MVAKTMERVVVLLDMDCFYAQVEQRSRPELWGKPVGVLQYSANGRSGLLALSYEARRFGVKRGMDAAQAKELCPHIEICLVPQGEFADKADVAKYRDASEEVFAVLAAADHRIVLEKASVDEAFLDLTAYVDSRMKNERRENIFDQLRSDGALSTTQIVRGPKKEKSGEGEDDEKNRKEALEEWLKECEKHDEQLRLAIAVEFVERLRESIREKTQFFCSAGIANNKTMAKLVCAFHKPRQQSVIPFGCSSFVMAATPISSVRGLGGKLGSALCSLLSLSTMADLLGAGPALDSAFPNQANYLRILASGVCEEPVRARINNDSIGIGKNFPGRMALDSDEKAKEWLGGLVKELVKRLLKDQLQNKRSPESVVLHVTTDSAVSRTAKIRGMVSDVNLMELLWPLLLSLKKKGSAHGQWNPPIVNISMSASKFVEGIPKEMATIVSWVRRRNAAVTLPSSSTCEFPAPPDDTDSRDSATSCISLTEDIFEPWNREEEEEDCDVTVVGEKPASAALSAAQFDLDEDGWQLWTESAFSRSTSCEGENGRSESLPEDVSLLSSTPTSLSASSLVASEVSRDIFDQLPRPIQQELIHEERLRNSRQLKEKEKKTKAERETKKEETSKKRKAKGTGKGQATPVEKPITAYFKK